MSKLPVVSGEKCIRALEKAGFYVVRRESSHITLVRDDPVAQLTVPDHREIRPGTLRAIIRQAGLTVEEFTRLL